MLRVVSVLLLLITSGIIILILQDHLRFDLLFCLVSGITCLALLSLPGRLSSPLKAFPVLLTMYYAAGSVNIVDYVGGYIDAGQWILYLVALVAYTLGVICGRMGGIDEANRGIVGTVDVRPQAYVRLGIMSGVGLAGFLLMIQQVGSLPVFDDKIRFVGVSGPVFYLLMPLHMASILLLPSALTKPTILKWSFVVVSNLIVLSYGARTTIVQTVLCAAIMWDTLGPGVRVTVAAVLGMVMVFAMSMFNYFRLWSSGAMIWYPNYLRSIGFPDHLVLLAPAYLTLRNGAGTLKLVRDLVPRYLDYFYGRMSFMALATLLPGAQPLPGQLFTLEVFNRDLSEMGGTAYSLLGGFFMDGGLTGITLGMFFMGLVLSATYRLVGRKCTVPGAVVYSLVLAHFVIWIYGGFLPNPSLIIQLVMIGLAFLGAEFYAHSNGKQVPVQKRRL